MLDYRLELIARVLEAPIRGSGEGLVVRRVCTDSRQVEPGDLFFALLGERFDGHQYASDAIARGAVAAVVDPRRLPARSRAEPLIEVPDPLLALGSLAAWHRNRFNVRMVAVTGSLGKTTTKDLIHALLSEQWRTLKSPGNLNAEIGLPMTLLDLNEEHEAAVVEMAMRGPGQIRYLARIARPEVAVITNIGLSHMELLGSQDAIAEAKAEILDFLPSGGAAVLPGDDAYFDFLQDRVPEGTRVVPFGIDRSDPETVTGMYLGPARPEKGAAVLGTRCMLRMTAGKSLRPTWIPLMGRHNMLNALAAIAAAQSVGVLPTRIIRGLTEARISGMRMEAHCLQHGSVILDDAYNASSPEAMFAALEVLREVEGIRRVAVLGDMLELGDASKDAHRQVGERVASLQPSLLLTVGERARLIAESAVRAGLPEERVVKVRTNEDAWKELEPRRRRGDVVLVKGSRGMAMEGLVAKLLQTGDQ
jgi:UDP-N-acetylmuramoyl-tripeptide--D-alanyl-D-alanine ligase